MMNQSFWGHTTVKTVGFFESFLLECPCAVRAKKRPQLCVVKEASADSVTIQVYPEISIVFGTKKNGHEKPDWGDVVVIRREVESGSPFIGDHHFQRAKKTALAAMRSYQKQKY